MAEQFATDDLPQATLDPPRRRRIAFVWIIPILAAAVAGGIAVQRVMTQGPTITILFQEANGVVAGKTMVKYKDVDIGQVTAVQLAQGYSKVQVTLQIDQSAGGLMVEDARFWVVAPRVSLSGVTGLSTLLAGNYIGLGVGQSTREQRHFVGLDTPPAITDQPGRRFVLKAHDLGSLDIGAPVYYRRLTVGEIAAYALAADGDGIDITVFVYTPYAQYVTPQTRFWDASGIDLSLGADGVQLRTQSLVSILAGGLAFDTPTFASPDGPAAENAVFTLYQDQTTAMRQPDAISRRYVLFPDSAEGLEVGAPVKLLGLAVGEVTQIGADLDPKTKEFRPRILITFYPDRLTARLSREQAVQVGTLAADNPRRRTEIVRHQVEDLGMRARIASGNLLTGTHYVSLGYFPTAPKVTIDWDQDPLELPVLPGGLTAIEDQVTSVLTQLDAILKKVDQLPLADIGQTLDKTMKTLDRALKDLDAKTLPELTRTLDKLNGTLAAAELVFKDANTTLLGPDAPAQQELRDALQEIARTARSLRALTDYLERHPEALIRGKADDHQ